MNVEMKLNNTEKISMTPIKQNDFNEEQSLKSMKLEENIIVGNAPDPDEKASYVPRETERPLVRTERTDKNVEGDLELVWSDLTITATLTEGKCCNKKSKQKVILDKVSGRVKSGECLAILGSSGAGKTTLLNYLSKKIESKNLKVNGRVTLNSEEINSDDFDSIAAYVMQDDILEPTMTPKEILLFTAKMKFNLSNDIIEKKVYDMIQILNLKKCQNTRIGDKIIRGVSGGERKRVSIGVELISDPRIIFLDEPTTGLDSYNAYELIGSLRDLASRGRMIIFTIHQPSSEIYQLLDRINILALGKTIYFGPQSKCFDCFDYLNLPVPPKYNPFEHFMETTNVTTVEDPEIIKKFPQLASIEDKQERYYTYISTLNSSYEKVKNHYEDLSPTVNGFSEETRQIINDKSVDISFFYQFALIFGRNMIITNRNPKVLYMKITQSLVNAVLMSILFVRLSKDFSGIQDRLGLTLNVIVSIIMGATTSTILVLADESKVFLRERSNKLYSVGAYFLAKIISEIPVFFVSNTILALILYYSVEFNDIYSHKFFSYIGILTYLSLAGSGYAFLLGSFTNNQEALINLNGFIMVPLLLMSGFFAEASNFAPYLIPFKYISPFKYGFQLLTHIEFNTANAFNCQNVAPDLCLPTATRFNFLEPFYLSMVLIAALIIFLKTAAFLIIYFFSKIKV